MTNPQDSAFSQETPEADVVEQLTPVDDNERDTWRDAAEVTAVRWDANEADLIEQALEVPDDEADFDR